MHVTLCPIVNSMTPRPAERPWERESSEGVCVANAWWTSGQRYSWYLLTMVLIWPLPNCALWNSHLGFPEEAVRDLSSTLSRNPFCCVSLGENFALSGPVSLL